MIEHNWTKQRHMVGKAMWLYIIGKGKTMWPIGSR